MFKISGEFANVKIVHEDNGISITKFLELNQQLNIEEYINQFQKLETIDNANFNNYSISLYYNIDNKAKQKLNLDQNNFDNIKKIILDRTSEDDAYFVINNNHKSIKDVRDDNEIKSSSVKTDDKEGIKSNLQCFIIQ